MDELIEEIIKIVSTEKDEYLKIYDLKRILNPYIEEQEQIAYKEGKEDGYSEGYGEGYDEGYEEGGGGCYD